jgi:hypothetical protein
VSKDAIIELSAEGLHPAGISAVANDGRGPGRSRLSEVLLAVLLLLTVAAMTWTIVQLVRA